MTSASVVMGKGNAVSVCEFEDNTKSDKKKRKKKEHKETEDNTKSDKKKRKKKENKKTDKDAVKLEESDNVDMGQGDDSVVSESEKCSVTLEEGKQADISIGEVKKRKGKRKRGESGNVAQDVGQNTMAAGDVNSGNKVRRKGKDKNEELEKSDNVDMGQGNDRVVSESEKCSLTLEEGKQADMSIEEGNKRKGKRKTEESGNVAQDVGQNTMAAGDLNSGNKVRRKGKDKNEASKMGKEKLCQRKNKRVSFTDGVEILGDGEEGSESQLVFGKRFTKEEDEIIMEAMMNYAKIKQLGEEGWETFRESVRLKRPEVKGWHHEIEKVLPHRPSIAVYHRARRLLYRSTARKWSEEEYEYIRRFVEKNGKKWMKLAADLGKSDIHVKDTWRRTKCKSWRKGPWTQEEYQNLFDMVNLDLRIKANKKVDHGHRNIRENISWTAISDNFTRSNKDCCLKWYQELASPLVKQGVWADTDDYLLVEALGKADVVCLEDVDWDNLLDHRSGDLCRQRWNQMVRMLGDHREKPFIEQVEVLSQRYSLEMRDYRK